MESLRGFQEKLCPPRRVEDKSRGWRRGREGMERKD